MKLIELLGKNVRIISQNNRTFEGRVTDYVYPEDNEPEEIESIIINDIFTNRSVEFPERDIKSLEILSK